MKRSRPKRVLQFTRLKYWIPAIVAAAFISTFSSHYFTPDQTGRVIVPILRWFLPHASSTLIRHLHFGIRKLAHVIEFGVFSITVFRALRGPRPGWRLNWALLTFLIAVSYAVIDEFHQTYVPQRHASPKDVANSYGEASRNAMARRNVLFCCGEMATTYSTTELPSGFSELQQTTP